MLRRTELSAGIVNQGVSKYEQEFIDQNVDKRRRSKERLAGPATDDQSFSCPTTAAAASEHV